MNEWQMVNPDKFQAMIMICDKKESKYDLDINTGAQPELFQGRGGFVESGHLDKLFVKNTKKRPRRKIFWSFFS